MNENLRNIDHTNAKFSQTLRKHSGFRLYVRLPHLDSLKKKLI